MKEKLQKLGKRLLKFLLKVLLLALVCGCVYLLYVHRRVIRAAIKGEPLPPMPESHPKIGRLLCRLFRKKK